MMSKFVGRVEELSALNRFYSKKGFQNIIIYGRRRIGKTALSLQFIKDKPGIYFLCQKNTLKYEAQRLTNKFAEEKNIFAPKTSTFIESFEFISKNLDSKKTVIILDEFPYLIEENKSILTEFQTIFDIILKNSNFYLILLGSSISIMETQVLGYKSPLYGRRTGQLKIKPLKINDLMKFFPKKSFEEIIEIYSVLDAIPSYLEKFSEQKTIFQNIEDYLLNKEEFLFEEVDFLLNQELREPKKYKRILAAISNGKNRLSRIADETNISVNVLTNYMDTLINLHMIKKEYPLTDKKHLSRNSIYKITDNYLKFWFRFIHPNIELLEERKQKIVLKKIKKDFAQYTSFIFEDVCKKAINNYYLEFSTGTWWHKQEEIDILAVNEKEKRILFCECKWQEGVDAKKILFSLKEKAKLVSWNDEERKEDYVVFAKSFKNKSVKGVKLFNLKDIEKMLR